MFKRVWTTPAGQYYTLYQDMLSQPHLLVAGATGSGKSVVINGLIHTALFKSPEDVQLVLIDPKKVELVDYRRLPHTVCYACEQEDMIAALRAAVVLMDQRYSAMQARRLKKYPGGHVYVVIDELADLMLTCKRQAQPLLQWLGQIGRAANVHVIAATQCPLREVIPTPIKVNFDARVALRTRSAQDSRNILGVKGCEELPRYGQGYYMTPEGCTLYNIPMYPEEHTKALVDYWMHQQRPKLKIV